MYGTPGTEMIAPGVVTIIVLVVKNMSAAMNPQTTPALGLKQPATINVAAVISVDPMISDPI